jgi:hypothetical protein
LSRGMTLLFRSVHGIKFATGRAGQKLRIYEIGNLKGGAPEINVQILLSYILVVETTQR